MRDCKQYTRRFLLRQLTIFGEARKQFRKSKSDPDGVRRWSDGNREYYKHAMAAVHFMMNQLTSYREPPFYPSKTNPKG